jgi:DNA-binding transcriptional MerR regulator
VRIGELADAVGVNPKTIRFYEQIGLLPEPERRPSGYRDYSDEDRERLVFVRTAQRLGLPLVDIKEILAFAERAETPCGYVRSVLARQVDELDQRIAELVELRAQLQSLARRAARLPVAEGGYCAVIEHAQPLLVPARAEGTVPMTSPSMTRRNRRARPRRP